MASGRKYWLSPQRGLPPPTGRLAGGIRYPAMGAFEAEWNEQGMGGLLPLPVYLQTRAHSIEQIQQAARVNRFLQYANERTQLASGPGASGGLPPLEYTSSAGYSVSPAPPPLAVSPSAGPQLYGTQPPPEPVEYPTDWSSQWPASGAKVRFDPGASASKPVPMAGYGPSHSYGQDPGFGGSPSYAYTPEPPSKASYSALGGLSADALRPAGLPPRIPENPDDRGYMSMMARREWLGMGTGTSLAEWGGLSGY